MGKRKSPEEYFAKALQREPEKHPSVNNKPVKKKLQPGTKKNYRRALALWDGYKALQEQLQEKEIHLREVLRRLYPEDPRFAEVLERKIWSPHDLEDSKQFVRWAALGIDGAYNIDEASLNTVV
jgi:hypothetical protein